jgi:stearoyl-CoA desaturase (delta-9 desaturase)
VRGALKGLWHAHLGWLLNKDLTADPMRYCPDLIRDRDIRFISKHYFSFVVAGLLVPGLLAYAMTQEPICFLTGVLWGGLVRFFVLNHVIYTLDSIGHYFGPRRFDTPDESRNVFWLSIASLGESWHNNHHAFPKSASFRMRWWEIDITALVIDGLEKIGLVRDVIRIDPQRIEQRAAGLSRVGGGRLAPSSPPKPLAEMPESIGLADVE